MTNLIKRCLRRKIETTVTKVEIKVGAAVQLNTSHLPQNVVGQFFRPDLVLGLVKGAQTLRVSPFQVSKQRTIWALVRSHRSSVLIKLLTL
jgi:hypothetical protein